MSDRALLGGYFDLVVRRHHLVQDAIERGDPERISWARQLVASSGDVRTKAGYEIVDQAGNHNLLPNVALNYLLDILYPRTDTTPVTQITRWYVGLFTSNSTPGATWDADWAKSGGVATELAAAAYDASVRASLTFTSAASGKSITSGTTTLTLATGQSGVNIYGVTLNSHSTVGYSSKGAGKVLAAATTFDNPKLGLGAGDELGVRYTLSAANG